MKNKTLTFLFCLLVVQSINAQNVGINNTNPKVAFDVQGAIATRAFTITPAAGNVVNIPFNASLVVISGGAATAAINGLFPGAYVDGQRMVIYNTNAAGVDVLFFGAAIPMNQAREFICQNPGGWSLLSGSLGTEGWSTKGNSGTIDGVNNFLGTLDAKPLRFMENSLPSGKMDAANSSYFFGGSSGSNSQAEASANSGFGYLTLLNNSTGSYNTAIGSQSLVQNKKGSRITAVGHAALETDTATSETVAIGSQALYWNQARFGNTAVGTNALYWNTFTNTTPILDDQGMHNTAVGHSALLYNRRGHSNVAVGFHSLYTDTISHHNTALGHEAMKFSRGGWNVAVGAAAMKNSLQCLENVAIGQDALRDARQVRYNIAIGKAALLKSDGDDNIAIGRFALTDDSTGSKNVAIGSYALNDTKGYLPLCIPIPVPCTPYNYGGLNTAIGYGAGRMNIDGAGNVFIGYQAGHTAKSSRKLYINSTDYLTGASEDSTNSLIYGDFAADSLLLNAKTINKFSLNVRANYPLEIGYGTTGKQVDAGKICYGCFGDPAHWLGIVGGGTAALGGDRVIKLWSEGGLRIKGNALPNLNNTYSLGTSGQRWSAVWTNAGAINTSDANLKTNITSSPYGLSEVMQMNPVQYNWKETPNEDLQIGFLAQDMQKIIPEAVVVPANGDPLGMKYTELIPVLVKAIQEQQKRIDELEKTVEKLQK